MKRQIGSRPVNSRESEKERRFWESYWKALADQRVRSERFIWHERAIQRFIRFISPKRLRDCDSKDVTDWLRLMSHQPRSEARKVRFLSFSKSGDSGGLGAAQVAEFLDDLAVRVKVAASTQNQALNALVFFFREGLGRELGELGEFRAARRPKKLPVVLTNEEVTRLLKAIVTVQVG